MKFIDFILRPDVGVQPSNFLDYATPNDARVHPPGSQTAKMVMLEDAQDAATLYDQV